MRRTARWLALGSAATVAIVALAGILLLATPLGTWAVSRLLLPNALPSGVTVNGLSGRLGSELHFAQVQVVADGLVVDVSDATVKFNAWGLLLAPRSLIVERLAIARVQVEQAPTQAIQSAPVPGNPLPLGAPELPIHIRVEAVVLDAVDVESLSGGHATITGLQAAAQWNADGATVEDFRLTAELASSQATLAKLQARGQARWPSDPQQSTRVQLTLEGSAEGLPPLAISTSVEGALAKRPAFSIRSAAPLAGVLEGWVEGLESPATLEGEARLVVAEPIDLATMDARLPPITMRGELSTRLQERTLTSQPELEFGLEAFHTIPSDQRTATLEGSLALRGDIATPDGLIIESLTLLLGAKEAPAGRISLQGTASTTPSVEARLRIDGLNPAWMAPPWDGRLDGRIAVTASLEDGDSLPTIDLTELSVEGLLREQPVAVQGRARLNSVGRLAIDGLSARSGEATLEVDGTLTTRPSAGWLPTAADLDASLTIPALEQVLPAGAGRVSGHALLRGDLQHPTVVATLGAQELQLDGTVALDSAEASIKIDGRQALSVDARAERLQIAGATLAQVTANAAGSLEQHALTLSITNPEGTLRTAVDGAADLDDSRWIGTMRDFSLKALDREWRLAADEDNPGVGEPPKLIVSQQEQRLSPLCVAAPPHPDRICISGANAGGNLDTQVSLDAVALQPWTSLLGLPIRLDASLAGHVRAQRAAGEIPVITGGVRLSSGALNLRAVDPEQSDLSALRWDELAAELATIESTLIATATADLTDTGRLDAKVRLPQTILGTTTDLSAQLIDAQLQGVLEIPERLADALPGVSDLRGRATVDLSASGALNAPRLLGRVELRGVEGDIAQAGLHVQEGELTLIADGNTLTLNASAATGEGDLQTQANFEQGDAGWRGDLSLEGERVLVMDTPQVRALISPSLRAQVDTAQLTIELDGSVLVPEAQLRPIDLSNAVRTSNDEVIVGQAAAESTEGWRTKADLMFTLGDKVSYRGGGFKGLLRGELAVRERPGEIPTGNGELSVADARFSVFGQTLEVNRGRVVFIRSPLTNPGLDVQATRTVEDITVRVDVRGTLRDQVITVSSTPALPQADALSYLVVGKPVSELQGGGDSELLANAARQGGLAGADLLARRVGRRIGLDDFAVEQDQAGENAQLVVGKYLSPRLYVRYGLGLFETLNTWLLRYDLSRRWAVETQTGAQNSVDVLYSIEN
ncbi:MAG: translocation/assembly module TamB domain-containing protein [Pseudomonadota bacterium]